jgi:hypothetical protein
LAAVLLVVGCPKKNHAPDAPSVPSGPSAVAKGALATFSSAATDPDADSVCIRFDWGDGDTSDWRQYVASGESVSMTYAWNAVAVCSVRAQAKDRSSLISTWSQPHAIHIGNACFGGQHSDGGYSVQQTTDGGYIVAGETCPDSSELDTDVWLIKTDVDNKVWDMTFNRDSSDIGSSVQQTSDGGYVIAGATGSLLASDIWLIKTDASGNKVWDKTFGKDDFDAGNSVQQTSDGGYIIAGWTRPFGANGGEAWLIKTDANGNKTWDKAFGDEDGDWGGSVQQTSDGGYVIAGATGSLGAGGGDVWLIKADADGGRVWDKTFGGPGYDVGQSVQQTSDGGYIIAGTTWSDGASSGDVWLIRTDADGNKVWDTTFGGDNDDRGYSVQQTSDGGYIIVGETMSYGAGWYDVWLIKTFGP